MSPGLGRHLILCIARTAPSFDSKEEFEYVRVTKPKQLVTVLLCTRALLRAVAMLKLPVEQVRLGPLPTAQSLPIWRYGFDRY